MEVGMQQRDVRFALAARADGMRQVRRLTAGIGVAALAGSAVVAVVLSHLPGASAAAARAAARSAAQTGSGTAGSGTAGSGTAGSGATGSGQTTGGGGAGQGGDGGSGQTANGGSAGTTQGGGSLQVPAQNPAPAAGLPQSVSGGS
jgi:hypothetical protein